MDGSLARGIINLCYILVHVRTYVGEFRELLHIVICPQAPSRCLTDVFLTVTAAKKKVHYAE